MPTLKVHCPHCRTGYTVDATALGKQVRCKKPGCGQGFTLAPPPAEAPPRGEGNAAPSWQPGDVILDLYEVKGLLGEGGMGRVYRVHHREWDLDLAVKSPRPALLAQAGAVENFEREAETWVK